MMRTAAILLGSSVALATAGAAAMTMQPGAGLPRPAGASLTPVGYYCSPGFEAISGGRCVATASTDPVDLYLNEPPAYAEAGPVHRHHRHRRGLRERY